MDNKNNKQRLFEVMENLNPEFKQVDEIAPAATTTKPVAQPDVTAMSYALRPAAAMLKQINTPDEFAGAFKGWFSMLGFSPQNTTINVIRVKSDVEKVMREMGYK